MRTYAERDQDKSPGTLRWKDQERDITQTKNRKEETDQVTSPSVEDDYTMLSKPRVIRQFENVYNDLNLAHQQKYINANPSNAARNHLHKTVFGNHLVERYGDKGLARPEYGGLTGSASKADTEIH